jgi:hypothetical protein
MNLNLMDPKLIVLAAVVVLIIAVLAWLYVRKRRSTTADLRQKFGPEYDRAVLAHGSERKAEAKLADRERRVEKLNLRDLDPMEHERFTKRWESVQSRFVDSPKGAVTEADDLVSSLMKTRGYPVSDFDQRAADISVDHPRVVENYRSAHEMRCVAPKPIATVAITEATPITIPSMVSAERSLFIVSARNAMRMDCISFFIAAPRPALGEQQPDSRWFSWSGSPGASLTTSPSRKPMIRSACVAISSECVTRTILMPWVRFSRSKMFMISALVRESSAPVGSSARMISGLLSSPARWPPAVARHPKAGRGNCARG